MTDEAFSPKAYIHKILSNVLISNDDDQSHIFELAIHLTKIYDHAIDTIKAVLDDNCCTVETALDIIQEVREGAYELWRGVYDDAALGRECINHINNNVDLDDLWDLISSNADLEEVVKRYSISCSRSLNTLESKKSLMLISNPSQIFFIVAIVVLSLRPLVMLFIVD